MYSYFDTKLKKKTVNIAPGEFYVSAEDEAINTVLGSCVAVAFYDPELHIGGLNHFMLAESRPGHPDAESIFKVERYGLYAMEAVINGMIKMGSRKSRIQAKVFGGAKVLDTADHMNVGEENILFADTYLATEGIPIISSDTGGNLARKIFYYPQTFKILLKRIQPSLELNKQMKDYTSKIGTKEVEANEPVLFND